MSLCVIKWKQKLFPRINVFVCPSSLIRSPILILFNISVLFSFYSFDAIISSIYFVYLLVSCWNNSQQFSQMTINIFREIVRAQNAWPTMTAIWLQGCVERASKSQDHLMSSLRNAYSLAKSKWQDDRYETTRERRKKLWQWRSCIKSASDAHVDKCTSHTDSIAQIFCISMHQVNNALTVHP